MWKWLAFTLAVVLLISLGHLFDHLLCYGVRIFSKRFTGRERTAIAEIAISPARLSLTLAVLRIAFQFIAISAIARLYIGALQPVVIWVIAQFLIRLVELLLGHVENVLNVRQQYASRSMLRWRGEPRRPRSSPVWEWAALPWRWPRNKPLRMCLAAFLLLETSRCASATTGKFGDLIGTGEDIGMRSTE